MMNGNNKYIQFRLALHPEKDKIIIEQIKRAGRGNLTQYIRDLIMEDYKRCFQSKK